MRAVQTGIEQVAGRLGCRMADGIAERVVFRSLFPLGLTVFDPLDEEETGGVSTVSHASARQEYRQLVEALNLPIRERAVNRRKAREEWTASAAEPAKFSHLAPGR
jgi:chromosome partitioning protein